MMVFISQKADISTFAKINETWGFGTKETWVFGYWDFCMPEQAMWGGVCVCMFVCMCCEPDVMVFLL